MCSSDLFTGVYKTLGWPGRVYKVVDDANKKIEEDRNHFMEQLRTDRERFSEELDEWDVEIKALSSLGDMADVEVVPSGDGQAFSTRGQSAGQHLFAASDT